MNVVFLNRLEKQGADTRITAQVSICERQGEWRVLWSETSPETPEREECWYAGRDWERLLEQFRRKVREKIGDGFIPLLQGCGGTTAPYPPTPLFRSRKIAVLQYYAERYCEPEIYDKLREWRWQQAQQENKAAYIIATNRILQMIGAFLPQTMEELAQIPGFGENRRRLYGKAILAVTQTYRRETGFPLDWVEKVVEPESFRDWLNEQAEIRERNDREQQIARQKLLEAIANGGTIDTLQKLLNKPRRELLQLVEQLDRAGCNVAPLIEAELRRVSPEDLQKAQQVFSEVGVKYLKPVLHAMFTEEELKRRDISRDYEWLRLYRLKLAKQQTGKRAG